MRGEVDREEEEIQRRADDRRAEEGAAGAKVSELSRKHGISEATYYNRKAKYAGMSVAELRRLKNWKARTASSSGCWPKPSWTRRR